jgi:hypothetical protein
MNVPELFLNGRAQLAGVTHGGLDGAATRVTDDEQERSAQVLDAVLDRALGVVELVADVADDEIVVLGRDVPSGGVNAGVGTGEHGRARRLLVGEGGEEFVTVVHVCLVVGEYVGEKLTRQGERLVFGGWARR